MDLGVPGGEGLEGGAGVARRSVDLVPALRGALVHFRPEGAGVDELENGGGASEVRAPAN